MSTNPHRLIGATIYALNRTHGLAPARPAGPPEVVVEILDTHSLVVLTDVGNVYANGDFGITRYADERR